jgi:hypothetical protein
MTYRDDRDATLARAEALEQDLKRTEAERDRLRAQVARLEHDLKPSPPPPIAPPPPVQAIVATAPAAPPVQTIVRVHTQALTPVEIKSLLDDVERGFARARSDQKVLTFLFVLSLVGSVPLYFTTVPIMGGAVTFLGLSGLVKNVFVAALNDAPQVLVALRERPDEILELVENKSTLTIVTRTKSAVCSTPNRADLLVRLARYCPRAIARR